MPRRRSIEFRLAAWYSLLLLGSLASLGAVLWFGMEYSLTTSVDDLLRERVAKLVEFVDAEFGSAQGSINIHGDEAEIKGSLREHDRGRNLLVIGDTAIRLTPETIFESATGLSSAADLAAGQFLGIELSREGADWIAEEITLERSFEAELREELSEYLLALPEGRWTRILSPSGQPFLPTADTKAEVPWISGAAPAAFETIQTEQGVYRAHQAEALLTGSAYRIQVASSLDAVIAARKRLLTWLAWAFPLGLLLSLGGGYVISRRALRPVEDIVAVAETMDLHRLSERLTVPPTGDVVERLARTLNLMLNRLEGSVRRLEEFTADASHELRSPVSVIRTTADLALRQHRDPDELRADMREIQNEAARLTALIEDLLTLARSDSGHGAPQKQEIDLSVLAAEVGEQFRRQNESREIDLDINAKPAFVRGHELSLRRLISILLDNALRHTPGDAKVSLHLDNGGGLCRLSVADTGEGIPQDEIGRVFDRFYRVDSSRNRTNGGVGLGLAIARWIALSHEARIGVESKAGEGATFTVEFPALKSK